MSATTKNELIKIICDAILESVAAAGPLGAPGGPLYAALMTYGCSLEQFEAFMAAMVSSGVLEKRGQCYYITARGKAVIS